ncbi:lysophospholipid acyltransferase 5-like [Tubulanus polymorphus]|uniref:lysophospholipid acyltransferase 5-like n=1 Tax=Tubulanus polymorphus TaxID=672921 RepID=UPI003DA556CC
MASTVDGADIGSVAKLATVLSTSEPALRLFISLLSAYPLSLIHRYTLYGKTPFIQHVYFALFGFSFMYFNFGIDAVNSIVNVLAVYLILRFIKDRKLCVGIIFFFNIVYLTLLYYLTATKEYDIKWTTPHCVLCLRLTGLVFDIYDGTKPEHELTSEQKPTALRKLPSLLEIFGHMFFFGGALVGPQFPMTRYLDFINGTLLDKKSNDLPRCVVPGLQRLGVGIALVSFYQIGSIYFPDDFLVSDRFDELSLWKKLAFVSLWAKLTLYKYVSCWLISEGSCIVIGLSYNGKDENGNDLWDGCANIKIRKYELSISCHDSIASFNINTNIWSGKYIYKRLKFLGNRKISQMFTLMYLALWHGLHSGYFMCFIFEFVVIKFEKDLIYLCNRWSLLSSIVNNTTLKPLLIILRKIYHLNTIGYAIVSFSLLKHAKYGKVYASIYYWGHLWFFVIWPLLFIAITKLLPKKHKEEKPIEKTE